MRPSRMLAIGVPALTAGLVAAIIGTGAPAAAASAVSYVALGDSYSSGVGAGGATGSCSRSPHAYPALWAAANPAASFTFAACAGSTPCYAPEIWEGQGGGTNFDGTVFEITP